MDFCWNFCGEQRREGDWGMGCWVETHKSEALTVETKK